VRLKVKIVGEIHDIGYRVFLVNLAEELAIDRFRVFNSFVDGKQAVIAVLGASEMAVKGFKERIEGERPEKAVVERIIYEDYENDVPHIERTIQVFQMEQWGKAIPILVDMRDKQDKMLEKQDETIEVIRDESERTRGELKEEIRSGTSEISSKLDRTNDSSERGSRGLREILMR
jgi:acylphosphatase